MGANEQLGGAADTPALARGDRFEGKCPVDARLDLDEGDQTAAPGDDVDLADRRAVTPRQDAPTAYPQMPRAKRLGVAAEPVAS